MYRTGGWQGIGEACYRQFALEQAHVIIADTDEVHGAVLADVLGAIFMHCGVGDKQQADAFVARTLQAYGRIDVPVHNAGIFKAAEFLDIAKC